MLVLIFSRRTGIPLKLRVWVLLTFFFYADIVARRCFSWQLRLYTNNHASCVAVGEVQTEEAAQSLLEKWGTVLKLAGRGGNRSGGLKRVVVKVIDVLKPTGLVPHKGAPPPAPDGRPRVSIKDVHSGEGFVLWDVAHVRLASAHRSFQGTPVPGGGADPDAYQDDFLDAPSPVQAVYRKGKLEYIYIYFCGS